MTPQQLIGLSVRLFSIWLVATALQFIGSGVEGNSQPGIEPTSAFYLIAGLIFCLAVVLWFFPMFIAHKLLPRTRFDDVLHIPAKEEIAVVACIILGLWLFVARVLPSLSHYIALAVWFKTNGTQLKSEQFHFVSLATVGIELAVSAVLCFKAHAISKFLATERSRPEDE